MPVAGLQVPKFWHWVGELQFTGLLPVHTPPWQVSVCVQALPSLQTVPLGLLVYKQVPLTGLHVPVFWHWLGAAHVTGFDPTQVPAWHASVCVQALPSLHAVPSVLLG